MFGDDNLKASDWMAVEEAEHDAQADRLVVLSDVWLDKPEVLDQLHVVFSGVCALHCTYLANSLTPHTPHSISGVCLHYTDRPFRL